MDYKKVLRLHYVNRLSSREIASASGCGKTTVNEFLRRFKDCPELSYPLSEDVTNAYLEKLLYSKPGASLGQSLYRDFDEEAAYRALSRKGETLKHLWQKYNAAGEVDGLRPLSYRQYCRRYSLWLDSKQLTFHIQRYPGVNLELDYAGKQLVIHNRRNPQETTKVTVFIAALTYSDYFYAEGMTNCDIQNWIRVNNNALDYFGGVTPTVTPDNCKVAVTGNKDWINPALNKDFQAWAEHNDTVITPAKVKSPRWKPVVEGHVKLVTMHILIDMEEMTFYSLDEFNTVLWEKVDAENRVNFERLSYSRRDLFLNEEKESLLPLQLLFIDDFAISRYSEEGMKVLYHLIKLRSDFGTSTLFSSQYAPDEWGKYLSDESECYGKLDGIRRRLTTGYTVLIELAQNA